MDGGEVEVIRQLLIHKNKGLEAFLRALSVCHTAVCEVNSKEVKYQASSPDELALVMGAKQIGYQVMDRSATEV